MQHIFLDMLQYFPDNTAGGSAIPVPSGKSWVSRFPTSKRLEDLVSPFRENVLRFIAALKEQGATITINATLRPPQRAYLMHYSFRIAHKQFAPANVPPLAGVSIDWTHGGDDAAALKGAKEMVAAYGIATRFTAPALLSNHITGNAIDMVIRNFEGKAIKKADGTAMVARTLADLIVIGESYKVLHKVADDPPHWSVTGK